MDIEAYMGQLEPVEALKECVLKRNVTWTDMKNGNFLTAEIKLTQGMIAQYRNLKSDYITIFFTDLSLHVTPEQFSELANALPRPPDGLIYRTLDDAYDLEDEKFWIYDMEIRAYLDIGAVPDAISGFYSCFNISKAYRREQYGRSWMVLTAE